MSNLYKLRIIAHSRQSAFMYANESTPTCCDALVQDNYFKGSLRFLTLLHVLHFIHILSVVFHFLGSKLACVSLAMSCQAMSFMQNVQHFFLKLLCILSILSPINNISLKTDMSVLKFRKALTAWSTEYKSFGHPSSTVLYMTRYKYSHDSLC